MLPIENHIEDIKDALRTSCRAVIQAPPGAGKTTRVPLALLDEPWLKGKKIILLEPRRLAAISCAGHMADLLEQKVGQTVGYQIRLDRKISAQTQIEVITEGIFTRKIQHDPSLADVGLVIFDEFHERNVHSDVGLALCLDSFEALRDDLRILVMSATIDVEAVSKLMGNAPVIVSKGKTYPVKTIYQPQKQQVSRPDSLFDTCISAIKKALAQTAQTRGDILVFLPGIREIQQVKALIELETKEELKLSQDSNGHKIDIFTLYGNLSGKEQAQAIAPSILNTRKVVLATSIAETSITIKGVDTVIDAGLMRISQFSWQTGMSRLVTIPVSKASADQRRGRAGRTGPGTCYRLWSEYDQGLLKAFTPPEILSVDLTGLVLELAFWGVSDPAQLKWLDLPDKTSFIQAQMLLESMGALDEKGRITKHGKKMAGSGFHPRLSHMIIMGSKKGLGTLACRLAAVLNERDFVRFDKGAADPDIRLRLELLEQKSVVRQGGFNVNKGIIHRILMSEKKIQKDFGLRPSNMDIEKAGSLLACAYPDRIAKKRNNQNDTFLTSAGKGVYFPFPCQVSLSEYIVALRLDGNQRNAKMFLAASYSVQDLEADFGESFKKRHTISLDKHNGVIQAKEDVIFQKFIVASHVLKNIDPDVACDIMVNHIQKNGLDQLPWSKKITALKDRIQFLLNIGNAKDLPQVSDENLIKNLDIWLGPFLMGIKSLKQLGKMDLDTAFLSQFTWEQQNYIEKTAPTHIVVPSGSKKPLKYRQGNKILESPVLEVRLQEMFGLNQTPKIAEGTVLITIALLSPAGRPVQITKDLHSFWATAYKEVKKDLAGRYPKHYWPEDPLKAMPTKRVKPNKSVIQKK